MATTRKRAGTLRPWILAMLAGVLFLGAGCSDDSTTDPPEEFAPPTGLTFENGDGYVDLSWTHSTSRAVDDWNGYHVYRHTASMAGLTAAQALPYKLSPLVTTNGYTDGGAQNGLKYYYAVRALHDDSSFSEWSNEIHTAARAVGDEVDLAEFEFSAQPSGLDCSASNVYTMSSSGPDNREFIDVYLGTTGNNDESSQALALKSPHRVLNGATAWADRNADLLLLGSGASAWALGEPPANAVWTDEIHLGTTANEIVDKVVAVKTPADNTGKHYYAKLRIMAMPGTTAGERKITVMVAYQSLADYPRFAAGR